MPSPSSPLPTIRSSAALPNPSPDSSTSSTTPLALDGYAKLPGRDYTTNATSSSSSSSSYMPGATIATATTNSTNNNNSSSGTTSALPPRHNKARTRIAVVIFFKGLFGAGILAIPGAFSSVGVPLGLLIFLAVSLVCLGTMIMLLTCKRLVREEQGVDVESYEELAGVVFGHRAFRIVQTIMALLTLIYCTGFIIVIAASLHDVFPSVHRAAFCAMIFPLLTGLSWIPFMKDLWFVSILGLGVYLFGVVGSTVFYSATHYSPPPGAWDWKWDGAAHFYGVAIYALEGINLTLPISASMKSLRRPPFVMTVGVVAFATITAFYSSYAYAAGLGHCDIIIQCLGEGHFVQFVRIALALSLIATHPVYLIVASEIFERALLSPSSGSPDSGSPRGGGTEGDDRGGGAGRVVVAAEGTAGGDGAGAPGAAAAAPDEEGLSYLAKARIIRAVEVFMTCLVGALIPNLGAFTSIVGATFVTLIGFIFPASMWLELQRKDPHASLVTKVRTFLVAGIVIVAGLVAMVVGLLENTKNLGKKAKG